MEKWWTVIRCIDKEAKGDAVIIVRLGKMSKQGIRQAVKRNHLVHAGGDIGAFRYVLSATKPTY